VWQIVHVAEKLQTMWVCRSVFCVLSDWLAVCPAIIKLWLDIRRIIGHKSNLPIPRVHAGHDTPDAVTDTVSYSQSCTGKNIIITKVFINKNKIYKYWGTWYNLWYDTLRPIWHWIKIAKSLRYISLKK